MPEPLPVVLIQIDENSRLSILRHEGVMVAFLDLRVDPAVVLLPEAHQPLEIDAAIRSAAGSYPIISAAHDDETHTASVVLSRLENRQIIVAKGPRDA